MTALHDNADVAVLGGGPGGYVAALVNDLAWTAHAHPTLPEAMLEAARGFHDAAIHVHTR